MHSASPGPKRLTAAIPSAQSACSPQLVRKQSAPGNVYNRHFPGITRETTPCNTAQTPIGSTR